MEKIEFNLPPAAVFNLQQIALADDDMVKLPGAAEQYRFIARHILELFMKNQEEDTPAKEKFRRDWANLELMKDIESLKQENAQLKEVLAQVLNYDKSSVSYISVIDKARKLLE